MFSQTEKKIDVEMKWPEVAGYRRLYSGLHGNKQGFTCVFNLKFEF